MADQNPDVDSAKVKKDTHILTVIAGHSGSGKSSSLANLGAETVVLNTERKVLPFSDRGVVNVQIETTTKLGEALKRLGQPETPFKILVIDSFSEYVDILMYECKQKAKGYDIYSLFNSELFVFFQTLKSLRMDVFIIGHPEILTDADGNRIQRLRVPGKINEGMIEKNATCTFFSKTIKKESGRGVDYCFITNTDGELPAKCLDPETQIRMADHSLMKIKDVEPCMKVLTPNGGWATVISKAFGEDQMYRIDQRYGMSYTANAEHILVAMLRKRKQENHERLSLLTEVEESIKSLVEKGFCKHKKSESLIGIHAACETEYAKLPIPPYMLGLWLGDGHTDGVRLTNPDPEIIESIHEYADSIGLVVTQKKSDPITHAVVNANGNKENKRNPFMAELKKLGLIGNKHIPKQYLLSSIAQRLELIAGLIDTDGTKLDHLNVVSTQHLHLANQFSMLCNSVGLHSRVYVCAIVKGKKYYGITICGDLSIIPLRLKRKKAPGNLILNRLTITPLGLGQYCGISIDDPKERIVLEDYTITHNTPRGMYDPDTEFTIDNDLKKIVMRYDSFYKRPNPVFGPEQLAK